jgi:predicted nucleic acid-binding protein
MSLLYVDTSAIAKLFIAEAESSALKKYLGPNLVTSGISRLEVKRVIDRNPNLYLKPAMKVLDNFQFVEQDQTIFAIAENFRMMPYLTSLDAIHLASALVIQSEVDAFVTYDKELARAAELLGFNVVAPA